MSCSSTSEGRPSILRLCARSLGVQNAQYLLTRRLTVPTDHSHPLAFCDHEDADTPEPGETLSFSIAGEECFLQESLGPMLLYSVNHLLKWSHGQKLVETQSSICSHPLTALSRNGCERALDVMTATARVSR